MFKKFLFSAATVAVISFASVTANAATITGYYSYDGGALTALTDSDTLNPDIFTFSGTIGTFQVNVLSGVVQPSSAPDLIGITATDTHIGASSNTLKLYFVTTGLEPGGSQTFTSQFTSNATASPNLTVAASTYLGTPSVPGLTLGSALFPPLLGTGSSTTSTTVPAGYTITAELDITAKGTKSSIATINVSAVPGPIVGAGLPGLIAACGGLLALARRRRKEAV